ncbi:hypothetical protein HZS_1892, partial [Henneguya salminicola]
ERNLNIDLPITAEKSMLFLKKIIVILFSTLTYIRFIVHFKKKRGIFPDEAFMDRKLGDLNIKILAENNNCQGAFEFIQWLKGCFDAIDKNYLKEIRFAIFDNETKPNDAIEQYSFKISNSCDLTSSNEDTEIETVLSNYQTNAINSIKTVMLQAQNFIELPGNIIIIFITYFYRFDIVEEIFLSMKLFYYENITPSDYNPPGFVKCDVDKYIFNEGMINYSTKNINTVCKLAIIISVNIRLKAKSGFRFPNIQQNINTDNDFSVKIECLCGSGQKKLLREMVKCNKCKNLQHYCCQVDEQNEVTPEYTCFNCLHCNNVIALDFLKVTKIYKIKKICATSLLLNFMNYDKIISTRKLKKNTKLDINIIVSICQKLENCGIIQKIKKSAKLIIRKDFIQQNRLIYFAWKDQNKHPEFVTNVLSPVLNRKRSNKCIQRQEKIPLLLRGNYDILFPENILSHRNASAPVRRIWS